MKKKIFICGISTECCSYSTLIQNKKDFEVLSGKKLLKYINFPYSKHDNVTFIPSKFYRSLPGGPVDKKFFIKIFLMPLLIGLPFLLHFPKED